MEKALRERFGEAVQFLRRESGKSQEDLDVVHRTYLSELERGLKSPTLDTIVRLADALGVSASYLVALATVPQHRDDAASTGAATDRLSHILSRAVHVAQNPLASAELPALFTGASRLADVESGTRGVIDLERLLAEAALVAFRIYAGGDTRTGRAGLSFITADKRPAEHLLYTKKSREQWSLAVPIVHKALLACNRTMELIHDLFQANDFPLFDLLGLRNLSSFVGAVFAHELGRLMADRLVSNRHQDGYPDLCATTSEGVAYIERLEATGKTSVKEHWSPYPSGGIEVKATCGNTPNAKVAPKPKIGEPRTPLLQSAEWKAHHRDTNNLLGIFWVFVDGSPTVLAALENRPTTQAASKRITNRYFNSGTRVNKQRKLLIAR